MRVQLSRVFYTHMCVCELFSKSIRLGLSAVSVRDDDNNADDEGTRAPDVRVCDCKCARIRYKVHILTY